jgi:hypothetical protein
VLCLLALVAFGSVGTTPILFGSMGITGAVATTEPAGRFCIARIGKLGFCAHAGLLVSRRAM